MTHRKLSRLWLVTAGLLLLAAALAGAAEMPAAIEAGPFLTGLRHDQVTISWQTAEPTTGRAECYVEQRWRFADSPRPARVHQVTLTGLPPATLCSYRLIVGGGEPTPFWRFRTAPDGPAPVRFAVYGDTRSNPKAHARVAQALAAHDPAFVVHTGDFATDGKARSQWVAQFFVPAADLLRRCPIVPAMGTHEKHSPVFYDYFAPPRDLLWAERLGGTSSAPLPTAGWFAWKFGDIDFLVLNSYASVKPGSPQLVWLEAALADCKGTWRIAVLHEPFFSSGRHGGTEKQREALLPMLVRGGVDVVFAGHEHLYERTLALTDGDGPSAPRLVEIVTGGGGAELHKVVPGTPWAAHAAGKLNFCIVAVEGDALVVSAYDDADRPLDCAVLTKANGYRDFGPSVPIPAIEFLQSVRRFKGFSFPYTRREPESKEFSLTLTNPSAMEMVGELAWDIRGKGWTLEPPSQEVRVAPGGKATVRFVARFDPSAEGASLQPVPQAVLRSAGLTATAPAFSIGAAPKPPAKKPETAPPPTPTDPFKTLPN